MSGGGCQREGVMMGPTMDSYCCSTPIVIGGDRKRRGGGGRGGRGYVRRGMMR